MKCPKCGSEVNEHPGWGLVKLILIFIGINVLVATVMKLNASNFDRNEYVSMSQIAVVLAVVMGGSSMRGVVVKKLDEMFGD